MRRAAVEPEAGDGTGMGAGEVWGGGGALGGGLGLGGRGRLRGVREGVPRVRGAGRDEPEGGAAGGAGVHGHPHRLRAHHHPPGRKHGGPAGGRPLALPRPLLEPQLAHPLLHLLGHYCWMGLGLLEPSSTSTSSTWTGTPWSGRRTTTSPTPPSPTRPCPFPNRSAFKTTERTN